MRYLIIEKEKGLFLGNIRQMFLFAKGDIFGITKAPSFDALEHAEYYINQFLPEEDNQYGVIEVDVKTKYVSVIDIIKKGMANTHTI